MAILLLQPKCGNTDKETYELLISPWHIKHH